jgi:hypothetical protein
MPEDGLSAEELLGSAIHAVRHRRRRLAML